MHDLPLSLVVLVLAYRNLKVVPGESLASAIVVHHNEDFLFRKECFIRVFDLVFVINGVSQIYRNSVVRSSFSESAEVKQVEQ